MPVVAERITWSSVNNFLFRIPRSIRLERDRSDSSEHAHDERSAASDRRRSLLRRPELRRVDVRRSPDVIVHSHARHCLHVSHRQFDAMTATDGSSDVNVHSHARHCLHVSHPQFDAMLA